MAPNWVVQRHASHRSRLELTAPGAICRDSHQTHDALDVVRCHHLLEMIPARLVHPV